MYIKNKANEKATIINFKMNKKRKKYRKQNKHK